MAAYAIFIRNSTSDSAEMAVYGQKARPAGEGHDLKRLVVYGDIETLEGEPAEGVVLLEFPTMEAARAWYNSPAYQAALPHRLKGGDYRVILTQGV